MEFVRLESMFYILLFDSDYVKIFWKLNIFASPYLKG
jgi:hypothetical protein